jgi:hypothetical protein
MALNLQADHVGELLVFCPGGSVPCGVGVDWLFCGDVAVLLEAAMVSERTIFWEFGGSLVSDLFFIQLRKWWSGGDSSWLSVLHVGLRSRNCVRQLTLPVVQIDTCNPSFFRCGRVR